MRSVIQLLKGVATDEVRVPFHEIHRGTLVAIAEHIFETSVDPNELDSDFGSVQSDGGIGHTSWVLTQRPSLGVMLNP